MNWRRDAFLAGGNVTDDARIETQGADDPLAALTAVGEVPLPPYITEPLADPELYQTVYARRPG